MHPNNDAPLKLWFNHACATFNLASPTWMNKNSGQFWRSMADMALGFMPRRSRAKWKKRLEIWLGESERLV